MSNGTKKKTPQNQEICSSIFFKKYNKMFQLVAEEGAEERAKVRLPEKANNLFGKLIQIGMKLPFLSFKQGKTDFE